MANPLDNLVKWKPGQSGNPGGRPKGSVSLVKILRDVLNEPGGEARAKAIIGKCLDMAAEGDDKHLRILLDRLDGPVVQKIEASVDQSFKAIDKGAADKV